MKIIHALILSSSTLLLALGLGVDAQGAPSLEDGRQAALELSIRKVIEQHLEAANREDLETAAKTTHKDSPATNQTLSQMSELFKIYNLDITLVKFEFVGLANDDAVARIIQTTTRKAGPGFTDNKVDDLQVFKRQGDAGRPHDRRPHDRPRNAMHETCRGTHQASRIPRQLSNASGPKSI